MRAFCLWAWMRAVLYRYAVYAAADFVQNVGLMLNS